VNDPMGILEGKEIKKGHFKTYFLLNLDSSHLHTSRLKSIRQEMKIYRPLVYMRNATKISMSKTLLNI
jgi:hypothetical protein